MRRATSIAGLITPNGTFLSTLSLRRATENALRQIVNSCISIHALLAESDADMSAAWNRFSHFYPRSPCGERQVDFFLFAMYHYFYPRSPCGERQEILYMLYWRLLFLSTLSLRRATLSLLLLLTSFLFLSTLSLRRATHAYQLVLWVLRISIHALLAESDLKTPCVKLSIDVFLSTLSLRRATVQNRPRPSTGIFLSTLSLRRATMIHRTHKKST